MRLLLPFSRIVRSISLRNAGRVSEISRNKLRLRLLLALALTDDDELLALKLLLCPFNELLLLNEAAVTREMREFGLSFEDDIGDLVSAVLAVVLSSPEPDL